MIGWGILGCGDIVRKRAAAALRAQPQSRLVAFCSRTPTLAAELARAFDARWSASRAELLADPEIDAVYVATEHYRHAEDVVAAAEAGKHVLCEKPLAPTVAECRRMIDACRGNGVALQTAYYRRYYPKLLRMKELLDSGAIGEPVTAHVHLAHRLPTEALRADNWRLAAPLSGGGQLADAGSHRLDLLCWMLGEPERVVALLERRELPIDAPDTETLLLRMASGVHVTAQFGFRTDSEDRFEIAGTRGLLSATSVDGPELRLRADGREERWELPRHPNVHFPLFDDFVRRIAAGEPPRHPGEAGMQATRILEAARAAAAVGAFVSA